MIDEEIEEGREDEEAPFRPQVRRRHRTFDAVEVSSEEGMQSARSLEVSDAAAPEVEEGSGSPKSSSFLKGVLELLREGLVGEFKFKSL